MKASYVVLLYNITTPVLLRYSLDSCCRSWLSGEESLVTAASWLEDSVVELVPRVAPVGSASKTA